MLTPCASDYALWRPGRRAEPFCLRRLAGNFPPILFRLSGGLPIAAA